MSPLFNIYGKDARASRVSYAPSQPVNTELLFADMSTFKAGDQNNMKTLDLVITYDENLWEHAIPVGSIKEAEKIVIDRVPVETIDFKDHITEPANGLLQGDQRLSTASINLVVVRKSNIIASRTRRGCGNVAIVGKEVLRYMADENSIGYTVNSSKNGCVGYVNGCIEVYCSNKIPNDEVIVTYIGKSIPDVIDGGAGVLFYGKESRLYIMPATSNSFGTYQDYFSRFRMNIVPQVEEAEAK